ETRLRALHVDLLAILSRRIGVQRLALEREALKVDGPAPRDRRERRVVAEAQALRPARRPLALRRALLRPRAQRQRRVEHLLLDLARREDRAGVRKRERVAVESSAAGHDARGRLPPVYETSVSSPRRPSSRSISTSRRERRRRRRCSP